MAKQAPTRRSGSSHGNSTSPIPLPLSSGLRENTLLRHCRYWPTRSLFSTTQDRKYLRADSRCFQPTWCVVEIRSAGGVWTPTIACPPPIMVWEASAGGAIFSGSSGVQLGNISTSEVVQPRAESATIHEACACRPKPCVRTCFPL